ncbi:biliverdin-producing heme oxygenase [Microvirga puerhi]|uniref:Biliverdin-producing heme oxygenase n=1 Tax=Microvirga puerhi TaxID=2876078 RepID=A0ABS7VL42_9HYPH|nr:biliverdin-producing heme oxygenase [Microvirga puerhi]MBZ6075795.1 biliverdin-producing heme oxygenase [Microvirga puerhi]
MTLLERLKVETRSAHERIEKAFDLERHTATLADYKKLLARFYGFHSAWEEAASQTMIDMAFFQQRCKAELIASDLRRLGLASWEIAQLPRCQPLMPLSQETDVLGSMYVVEGSTLGGTIIAQAVKRRLGLTAETGCGYFQSYGRDTARMWKSFGERLLAASSPIADDRIVVSAQRTFAVMQDWLGGKQ